MSRYLQTILISYIDSNDIRKIMDLKQVISITNEQWANKDFVMENMEPIKRNHKHMTVLNHVSTALKNDFDVVMLAVSLDHREINYASDELCRNEAIVLRTVKSGGLIDALQSYAESFPDERFHDEEFVKKIINENIAAMRFASEDLLNSPQFILDAIKNDRDAVGYIGAKLARVINEAKSSSPESMKESLSTFTLKYLPSYILHQKLEADFKVSDKAQELINSLNRPGSVSKHKQSTPRMKI